MELTYPLPRYFWRWATFSPFVGYVIVPWRESNFFSRNTPLKFKMESQYCKWFLEVFFLFPIFFSSWWLNQPIWKICSSNWIHLPQSSGWKSVASTFPFSASEFRCFPTPPKKSWNKPQAPTQTPTQKKLKARSPKLPRCQHCVSLFQL